MAVIAEQFLLARQLVAGPFNPRKHFPSEALHKLSETIKLHGLIHPILARPLSGDQYQIIAGERRWRAAQLIAPDYAVAVRIVDANDDEAAVLAFTENDAREDLSPMEQAFGAAELLARFNNQRAEVCARLGWSAKLLDRRLALMQCTEPVRAALIAETILLGHAELLAAVPSENQATALARIVEAKLPVHEVKRKLLDLSQSLASAIFDQSDCIHCPFNSTRQTTLFQEAIGAGHCTNSTCFGEKTDAALEASAGQLQDEYPTVHFAVPNDSVIPLKLVADGPLGVGAEQAQACRACANFGCTISKCPGTIGEVTPDLCFDAVCNASKVAARVAAEASPGVDTESSPTEPQISGTGERSNASTSKNRDKRLAKSVATSRKLKDYRETQWRNITAKHIVADPTLGLRVLLGLGLGGKAEAVSHLKMATAIQKITARKPAIGSLPKSLQFIAETAVDDYPRILAVMAASAMFDIDAGALVQIMRFTALDLGRYWRINANYLDLLTRSEIAACAQEIGLATHLGETMQQIVKLKKPDMIAALLKAEGFEFAGQVPANMRYPAKP
jgi:ParB family transcriptional regulator, chromosome partitioning protein